MGSEDSDVTQISLQLEGLSISITRTRVVPDLGPLAPEPLHSEPGIGSTPNPNTSSPASAPNPDPAASVPGPSLGPVATSSSSSSSEIAQQASGQPALRSSSLDQVEASFPPVPSAWIRAAVALRASGASGQERVKRAWLCGCWARELLEGRSTRPRVPSSLPLANRFYAVARSANGSPPEIYSSKRDFSFALEPLHETPPVFQAFPSELECRVYLEAAGITSYLPSY